ncbi:hypothetical protein, partial [Marinobacter goseongensis]|uniref:hypothetical protein n=1 Tax=Marinobacter goseongensis TaxID=453838 RepID=UPI0020048C46
VAQSRWRILHRSAALSTVYLKNFKTRFLQYFQTVDPRIWSRLIGLPLEGDAHSTDLPEGVNDHFRKSLNSPEIGHAVTNTRAIFFFPA